MDASIRVITSSRRHLSHSLLLKPPLYPTPQPLSSSRFPPRHHPISVHLRNHHSNSNPQFANPLQFLFPHSLSSPHSFNLSVSDSHFARISSSSKHNPFTWHYAFDSEKIQQNGVANNGGRVVTAVLLGWLGAQQKHLRRYVEFYNKKGIHAITFVATVRDVLSFDLGRKLEERIGNLADELANWVSGSEKDGKERVLIFHTFSNTGWLAYGAILDNLHGRQGVREKMKGCVVDSGGDPYINPKVWAAGFTAALLKKRSSFTSPTVVAGEGNELGNNENASKLQQEPLLIETLLFSALEKLFSFLLSSPNVNQRLTKVIDALSNPPPCPQLYLYSTADKVIPYKSVESSMSKQSGTGVEVLSYNFVSSPHVDHYRAFPDIYASQLESFLKLCLVLRK